MTTIILSSIDLLVAAGLVLALGVIAHLQQLQITRALFTAALRTVIQLMLIGMLLKVLFQNTHFMWMGLMALMMLLVAGRETLQRQRYRLNGWQGFTINTSAMFVSSFTLCIFTLTVILQADPWYTPQYMIPILGMLLGNTMSGIALSVDRLTETIYQQRRVIEQRLMLGEDRDSVVRSIKRSSIRSGLMPIINAMTTAGLVNLPGMMTGQILAGTPPLEAVKYQILILFLIAAGTGSGVLIAVNRTAYQLFDQRQRLRLNQLRHEERD